MTRQGSPSPGAPPGRSSARPLLMLSGPGSMMLRMAAIVSVAAAALELAVGVWWWRGPGLAAHPPMAIIFVAACGAVLLLPAGILLLTGLDLRRDARRAAILRLHGQRARATIQSMRSTGTRNNGIPRYRLVLQVEPDGQAPYRVTTELLLEESVAAGISERGVISVLVDPNDRSNLLVGAP